MSKKGRLLIVMSIVSFLSLCGLFFVIKVWMPFMWFVFVPGVLGFVGWIFLDFALLRDFFGMKTTKKGLNMGAVILLAVISLTAVNFLAARHSGTIDFSNNYVNSISGQSIKILDSLDSNLNVKFFYQAGAERAEENKKSFRELIKHYQDASNKIQIEFVEINERAKLAKEFGATKGSGEAFVEYGGKKNRVENYTEQDFTNAVIKLTRKKNTTVYFLEGHNERSIDDEKSEISLFGFKQLLEKNSYNVKKFNFATSLKVPTDANAVIIAGPSQQFQPSEIKAVEDYLQDGGSIFVMLDGKESFGMSKLLNALGIELGNQYIFNVFSSPMGQVVNAQAATVAVGYSLTNEITKVFANNQMTVFRNPVFFKLNNPPPGIQTEVIVKTPESSVALEELDSKDYVGKPKSYSLGVSAKGKLYGSAKEFSAVFFSDVDFVSNILLYQNLNRDLALNAISSLSKETDLIAISAKEPMASKMLVSPPEFGQFFKFMVVGVFFPLPFLFMILSIFLWYRRRHA